MTNLVPALSDQDRKFAMNVLLGMSPAQAARNAGYPGPEDAARRLMKRPDVLAFLEAEQAQYRDAAGVDRKQVVDGIVDAIAMAKTMADPQTMIVGYRELGRMLGYYAPEEKKVKVDVSGRVTVAKMDALPDAELVKLIESQKTLALEGEFTKEPSE